MYIYILICIHLYIYIPEILNVFKIVFFVGSDKFTARRRTCLRMFAVFFFARCPTLKNGVFM